MKKRASPIYLDKHFIERWHEAIGEHTEETIKGRLRSALVNKTIWGAKGNFAIEIENCKAICFIDWSNTWVFITLLRPGMILKEGEAG